MTRKVKRVRIERCDDYVSVLFDDTLHEAPYAEKICIDTELVMALESVGDEMNKIEETINTLWLTYECLSIFRIALPHIIIDTSQYPEANQDMSFDSELFLQSLDSTSRKSTLLSRMFEGKSIVQVRDMLPKDFQYDYPLNYTVIFKKGSIFMTNKIDF